MTGRTGSGRSYYGRPIVRAPVWKWDIPAYFFTGGVAAGSALLAAGAQLTGRPVLRRAGRLASLGALGASTVLLVHDLGRPGRFHHMLRVVKPTSPMSMGTWILTAFGAAAGVAAAAELAGTAPVTRRLPGSAHGPVATAGRIGGVAAAAVAPAVATYTAVLIADTAVPAWRVAYGELPFVFAGGALTSGAGVGLIGAGLTARGSAGAALAEAGPARRLAVAGAALELVAARRAERGYGPLSEPFRTGRAGRLLRAAQVLTAAGVAGAVLSRRSRAGSVLAGAALLLGSLAARFGVYAAGVASADDPKYVTEHAPAKP